MRASIPRIVSAYMGISGKSFLTYRLSAFLTVLFSVILLLGEVMIVDIYYRFDDTISGWSEGAFFILIGSINIMTTMYTFLFEIAHDEIVSKVSQGLLDHDLVRPIDSQILTSICRVDFAALLALPLPIWLVVHGVQMESLALTGVQIAVFFVLLSIGTFVVYAINQIAVTLSFWFTNPTSFTTACEQLIQMGTKPRQVYPRLIRYGLAYIVPIVLCSTVSVTTLTGGLDWGGMFGSFLRLLFLLGLSRFLWTLGLRRYSSASS